MAPEHFNFSHPLFLWGLLIIPIFWLLYGLFYHKHSSLRKLDDFIDAELLPHLLINRASTERPYWSSLLMWSLMWGLLMIAVAGPRWNFTEIEVFTSNENLVILLDLSESMDAEDIKPSRLARAHQEIEDILELAKGVNIGMIAFAADAHMINPLTDDRKSILHLLPSLETDLVSIQGSRLTPALAMASRMLAAEPGKNKSILVISDGGLEDISSAISEAGKLRDQGVTIQTLAVGSATGAPIPSKKGGFIKQNGTPVISKLGSENLEAISREGGGTYQLAHYADQDSRLILDELKVKADVEMQKERKTRQWEERFYLVVFPLMLMVLLWFRRSFVFPVILACLLFPTGQSSAGTVDNLFKNEQQQGEQALEQGDYATAAQRFKDPYRQGVAQYKAGKFAEAEALFSKAERPAIAEDAAYNRGNALAMQKKYQEAVDAYEQLLKIWPDNAKAKHNLEVVKKILEQQKKEQEKQQQNQNQNQQQQNQQQQGQNQQEQEQNQKQDEQQQEQGQNQQNQQQQNKQEQAERKEDQQNNQNNSQKQNAGQDQNNQEQEEQNGQQGQQENTDAQKNKGSEADNQQDELENNAVEAQKDKKQQESSMKQESPSSETEDQEQEKKEQQGKEGIQSQASPQNSSRAEQQAEQVEPQKTQKDIDADQWLNRVTNDPKTFLHNQFYIESKRSGTKERGEAW